MRAIVLSALAVTLSATPCLAELGAVSITSAIRVSDDIGEVRGKVELNGETGAFVTVKNGGATYTTATDADGKWSILFGIRSNSIDATARTVTGQTGEASFAEASVPASAKFVPPASPELFALTKRLLTSQEPVTAENVQKLSALMEEAIMHGGGWGYDERMILLLLGSTGRIIDGLDEMSVTERQQIRQSLDSLGQTLYKGVVRGALDQ